MIAIMRSTFAHGYSYQFYCIALGLLFFSVGVFRGVTTGDIFLTLAWWIPSIFWLWEFALTLFWAYVRIGRENVEIRSWVFLPSTALPATVLSEAAIEESKVTFYVDDVKGAAVYKFRMGEENWQRFIEFLRTNHESSGRLPR